MCLCWLVLINNDVQLNQALQMVDKIKVCLKSIYPNVLDSYGSCQTSIIMRATEKNVLNQ